MVEKLADLFRLGSQLSRLSDSDHLDGRSAASVFQSHIDEIETQHAQEHVEQGTDNLRWVAAAPDGRKSEDADQIIDAALKTLDLLGGMFGLHFQVRPLSRATQSGRLAVREARAEIPPAVERTDSVEGCRR